MQIPTFQTRYILLIAVLLTVMLTGYYPAAAQDTPGISIIGLLGFDPTIGKRNPTTEFTWPQNRQIAALVRYETSGYDKRKSVEIFWEILNNEGRRVSKYANSYQVHAGKHEATVPVTFNLDEMFGTRQFTYKVEVKLIGGERLSRQEEFTLAGPPMPEINIDGLTIAPAEASSTNQLNPGDNFSISGTVEVRGNTSGRLPSLVVWALMADDTLEDDPWDPDPFSDSYWDWTQLDSPSGRWEFEIEGRLPLYFIGGTNTERLLEAFVVVSFGDNPASRTSVSAMISNVDPELMVSGDLDNRLVMIERNWNWELTNSENPQDTPQWPQPE